jgi:hypothetical protein
MPKLYEIKPSPGKGLGVFATQDIPAGKVIVQDKAVMQLPGGLSNLSLTEEAVVKALKKLSPKDQARFLALHEGSRNVPGKHLRIYKANLFMSPDFAGNGDMRSFIPLEMSRINHSCVPNSGWTDINGPVELLAMKNIRKGEEIFHIYNDGLHGMSNVHRDKVLYCYYGFHCTCPTCSQPPEKRLIHDARRNLIHYLSWTLNGNQPKDLRPFDAMTPENAEEMLQVTTQPMTPLETPLTRQQKTAYHIILANLYEAEGLLGEAAQQYQAATFALVEQMIETEYLGIFRATDFQQAWMQKGLEIMTATHGEDSPVTKLFRDAEKAHQESVAMRLYHGRVSHINIPSV